MKADKFSIVGNIGEDDVAPDVAAADCVVVAVAVESVGLGNVVSCAAFLLVCVYFVLVDVAVLRWVHVAVSSMI